MRQRDNTYLEDAHSQSPCLLASFYPKTFRFIDNNKDLRTLGSWNHASVGALVGYLAGGGCSGRGEGTIASRTHNTIIFIDDEGSHEGCGAAARSEEAAGDQAQGTPTTKLTSQSWCWSLLLYTTASLPCLDDSKHKS